MLKRHGLHAVEPSLRHNVGAVCRVRDGHPVHRVAAAVRFDAWALRAVRCRQRQRRLRVRADDLHVCSVLRRLRKVPTERTVVQPTARGVRRLHRQPGLLRRPHERGVRPGDRPVRRVLIGPSVPRQSELRSNDRSVRGLPHEPRLHARPSLRSEHPSLRRFYGRGPLALYGPTFRQQRNALVVSFSFSLACLSEDRRRRATQGCAGSFARPRPSRRGAVLMMEASEHGNCRDRPSERISDTFRGYRSPLADPVDRMTGPASRMRLCADLLSSCQRNPRPCATAGPVILSTRSRGASGQDRQCRPSMVPGPRKPHIAVLPCLDCRGSRPYVDPS
jgi:hypothetical protein